MATISTINDEAMPGARTKINGNFTAINAELVGKADTSAVTAAIVAERSAAATLSGKSINGSTNTLTNIPAGSILGVIPIANLATGTPDGTRYVDDSGQLTVPPGTGGGGGLGGSTGGTSNALLKANGTGGATVQSSGIIVDASNNMSAVANLGTSGIFTQVGATIKTASALGALAIDVSKVWNTKSVAVDSAFTFTGTPATNQWFSLLVTNTDIAPHTITIPTSFSVSQGANVSTVAIDSLAKVVLTWQFDGGAYNLYGDPPLTTGTGAFVQKTAPTIAGLWLQQENSAIQLDTALSADGTYCGIAEAGTAGTTLAFGDLVYLAVADSRWELTDADAEATAGPVKLGICVLAAAGDGSATMLLLWGKVRADAKFPTLTVGAPAYVSTTAGAIQVAQPSGTDDIIRVVGYSNTQDELYFCPGRDYISHV